MTRTLSSLSALVLVALLASPVSAGNAVNNPPSTGGGGGAVSSVSSGGGCVTVLPTTGAVVITSTGCAASSITLTGNVTGTGTGTIATTISNGVVTLGMQANLAANSFECNNTGSPTAPLACTATQAYGVLGVLPAANFPALTGDVTTAAGSLATTIAALPLSKLATQANQTVNGNGSGSSAAPVALVISAANQLVATSTTLASTFAAGVAGGQTLIAGTASGDSMTFTSTSNATKGKYVFGSTSHLYFDEANDLLVMGNSGTVPTSGLGATLVQFNKSSATSQYVLQSNNSTGGVGYLFQSATATAFGSPPYLEIHLNASTGADSARILLNPGAGQANAFLSIGNQGATAGDDIFIATNSATERTRWLMAGGQTNINTPYVSWTSAGTALTQANGTTFEYQITPPSQASASGSKWDGLKIDPITATFTGGAAITTATGVNLFDVEAPTITSSSATTIAVASTLSLGGPPVAGGSVTITSPYTLNVRSGNAFFGGSIAIANTLATPGSGVIVTTDAPTAVVSLSLKYINMQVNGVTTYVLALQ